MLVVGLCALDGDVEALADRLTTKREAGQAPTATPIVAAKSGKDDDLVAKLPPPPAGSHDIGALDDVCVDGAETACKRWAMDGFYRAIVAARSGKLGRALRVSWFGDSVVATDALPGRLRARMQRELGDGGPGFVYVLAPHRFCKHESITRSGGDNFLTWAIASGRTPDGFYGPGGASVETNSGKASIKLVGDSKVTRAELYFLAQPNGGTATVSADGVEIAKAVTLSDKKQPAWVTGVAQSGASKFEIKGAGKTRLFGIQLENDRGAVVDNFGIVSVHVKSFAAHDADHWMAQLAHRNADLVMIMIGANEAQWLQPRTNAMRDYQSHYERLLGPIRRARPSASCLVVSPTDQAEAVGTGYESRAVMPVLVEAQRKAAHAQGCAFYSTYAWMGGKGSAAKWHKRYLISSDLQHLSEGGADKIADGIFDALINGAKKHASR